MAFDVSADAYERFMGRFSTGLSAAFADFAGVADGAHLRVLDVGCGPGILTAELVSRVGADRVAAVDPMPRFVGRVQTALAGVDARTLPAEELPFDSGTFDAALAQLVVPFMTDPVAGVREMGRVCRPGGTVAASLWDHLGGRGPVSPFWTAVRALDPDVSGEDQQITQGRSHIPDVMVAAGLTDVVDTELVTRLHFGAFDEWWAPYLLGVGPAGDYVAGLDHHGVDALRAACLDILGAGPFDVEAVAWAARGVAA